jgi:hypothetical protein
MTRPVDPSLWSLHQNVRTFDCALREVPERGWEVRIAFQREVLEPRMFGTCVEAVAFAEEKLAEFLSSGWGTSPETLRP